MEVEEPVNIRGKSVTALSDESERKKTGEFPFLFFSLVSDRLCSGHEVQWTMWQCGREGSIGFQWSTDKKVERNIVDISFLLKNDHG